MGVSLLTPARPKNGPSRFEAKTTHSPSGLQSEQLIGEEILTNYTARIGELEELIAKHDVVTLPQRQMRIRLASEAESAAIPSPFMLPPRLMRKAVLEGQVTTTE